MLGWRGDSGKEQGTEASHDDHPVDRPNPTSIRGQAALTVPTAVMAPQLPPLTKFSGEVQGEGKTFEEWAEQFEMVAELCHWDEPTRLVNLVTRLKGQAFSFYRSCNTTQRASYSALVEKLKKWFTPVYIQRVQSSLFQERKQKQGEPVDAYAQGLRCLPVFYKACPKAQQGNIKAESMGRSVLTYQFVTGLLPELKTEVAGVL